MSDECSGNDIVSSTSCPICLDVMSTADTLHPIPHPPGSSSSCQYNFCLSCLTALYTSSQDDYEMASDGNRHVKVKLACPNCRSQLSIDAVEQTVRLRQGALAEELQHIPDGELSAGQLRCKHQLSLSNATTTTTTAAAAVNNSNSRKKAAVMEIDTTLFGGLDIAMSEQEQKFVTSLMTSGYPHDLCQAATILCGIANLLRDGKLLVSNKNHTNTASSSSSSTRPRSSAVLSHGYSNAGVRTNLSARCWLLLLHC
jgi:uncharacterized protein YbaR (Trm112 family)